MRSVIIRVSSHEKTNLDLLRRVIVMHTNYLASIESSTKLIRSDLHQLFIKTTCLGHISAY